jgi:hypothetical protein
LVSAGWLNDSSRAAALNVPLRAAASNERSKRISILVGYRTARTLN